MAKTNLLSLDPTRSVTLRRAFARSLSVAFSNLRRDIIALIVGEDGLGLKDEYVVVNVFCATGEGGGIDPHCTKGGSHGGASLPANVQLGYEDGNGGFRNAPSHSDVKHIIAAHAQAIEKLHSQGVSTAGMDKIKIVLADNVNTAGAHATGDGLTYKYHPDNEKLFEEQFHKAIQARKEGEAPLFAFENHTEVMIHELGHNIMRNFTKKEYKEWEVLYEKHNSNINNLPSFYSQENSSELWAESVVAVVGKHRFGGTARHYDPQDKEVEDYVRSKLYKPTKGKKITTNKRWKYATQSEAVSAFDEWMSERVDNKLLSSSEETKWRNFVQRGFDKGAARAFDDTSKVRNKQPLDTLRGVGFVEGKREQFLRQTLYRATAVEKLKLLQQRTLSEVKGMCDDLKAKAKRVLTDGLVSGLQPTEIATRLSKQLKVSLGRAQTIAYTELVRAHADGQLEAMEQLGVTEVGVSVEWSTTATPCKLCQPLKGVVLKITEARGMIPRHPRCMCAWQPSGVGEDKSEKAVQKRGKYKIDKAIVQSQKRQGETDWGPNKPITKDRPKPLLNVECDCSASVLTFSNLLKQIGVE